MSPWSCIQTGLLLLAVILGLYLAGPLFQEGPVVVSETRMTADWRELERLAREQPYHDHGQR
ncbi:hypothetical protein Despr_2441 [Desulfobulbus propionicus DSM 2032]|uniref:Uncharacterized protein n=1 Tax=Desulfobulbus propionicus (strain ATCC 33891 / DSM 2032 / VKM B-1956 / 1pr3) TaxID=577650 RepID=A0A7U3YNE8_DESPD|nr:hypothetical protein [Desulfobulbus propionicus]ADW18580.1 hypothetical protein Despr_2441 [Desulfobulbus propionicus DSM 2032]